MGDFDEYFTPHEFFTKVYAAERNNAQRNLTYGLGDRQPRVPFLLCRPHGRSPQLLAHFLPAMAAATSHTSVATTSTTSTPTTTSSSSPTPTSSSLPPPPELLPLDADSPTWGTQQMWSQSTDPHQQSQPYSALGGTEVTGVAAGLQQLVDQLAGSALRYDPCLDRHTCLLDHSHHPNRRTAQRHLARLVLLHLALPLSSFLLQGRRPVCLCSYTCVSSLELSNSRTPTLSLQRV
jgi:hypothetical protein